MLAGVWNRKGAQHCKRDFSESQEARRGEALNLSRWVGVSSARREVKNASVLWCCEFFFKFFVFAGVFWSVSCGARNFRKISKPWIFEWLGKFLTVNEKNQSKSNAERRDACPRGFYWFFSVYVLKLGEKNRCNERKRRIYGNNFFLKRPFWYFIRPALIIIGNNLRLNYNWITFDAWESL